MLRLTLLRLPRLHPAHLQSRANHGFIAACSKAHGCRRHASSSSNSAQDSLKPTDPKPADAVQLVEGNEARKAEADKKDDAPVIHIPPSSPTDAAKESPSKDPQPQPHDVTRSSSGSQPAIGVDLEDLKAKLRVWSENAAIAIRERTDRYTTSAIKTFAQLGRELNKVTGYGEIESLKRQVAEQEARIKTSRARAKEAKQELERATLQRAKSQREVNDLLSRKSSWTDDDVVRFTALVRKDHLYEQAEAHAKADAIHTEDEVEREFTELMRAILNRYHEEQIWSDKIRSASTYGSLTVIGLNMLIFILAIIIVEPWKRRKLAQTFERKLEEMSTATTRLFDEKTDALSAELQDQRQALTQLVEVVNYSMQPAAVAPPVIEETVEESYPPLEPVTPEEFALEKVLYRTLSRITTPDPEMTVAVAATATIAGIIGWAIGNWFSS